MISIHQFHYKHSRFNQRYYIVNEKDETYLHKDLKWYPETSNLDGAYTGYYDSEYEAKKYLKAFEELSTWQR